MKHTFGSIDVQGDAPAYLDCAATSPMEPAVREEICRWLINEIGNAGSRTHQHGARANSAVQKARSQIAHVVGASSEEVIFTSGATESNNLAILGLSAFGKRERRQHIVSTAIEHKAVLEPLEQLSARGFNVTLVPPEPSGEVSVEKIIAAMRPDTLLVSVMQVNNETGTRQPLEKIAAALGTHEAFFHVDAAQGFGKEILPLRESRIDLISISSHKVYGPLGIGALIARRRGFKKPPLEPLMFGGGQERGLRPGTLPVPLIVGFGLAAEIAENEAEERRRACLSFRQEALAALRPLGICQHSPDDVTVPHILNFSVPGVDSEAFMVSLKTHIACSNGSACTSQKYEPSHVLVAMGLSEEEVAGAVRLSWCHMTPKVDWQEIASKIDLFR